jgi:pilus assembly protein Flp/PilA
VGIREKHSFNFRKVMIMKTISSLKTKMASFATDESGATLIEYGVLAALIILVSIVIIGSIGNKVLNKLTDVDTAL